MLVLIVSDFGEPVGSLRRTHRQKGANHHDQETELEVSEHEYHRD